MNEYVTRISKTHLGAATNSESVSIPAGQYSQLWVNVLVPSPPAIGDYGSAYVQPNSDADPAHYASGNAGFGLSQLGAYGSVSGQASLVLHGTDGGHGGVHREVNDNADFWNQDDQVTELTFVASVDNPDVLWPAGTEFDVLGV